jgi:hypothetical protein
MLDAYLRVDTGLKTVSYTDKLKTDRVSHGLKFKSKLEYFLSKYYTCNLPRHACFFLCPKRFAAFCVKHGNMLLRLLRYKVFVSVRHC